MKKNFAMILLSVLLSMTAHGALIYNTGFQNGGAIPNGNIDGWSDTRNVSDYEPVITGVSVNLNMSGGYNGDLYVYLAHSSGFAVLMNRVGVGSAQGDAFGSSGSGFNLTFASGNPNVHFGLGNGTSGTYAPDGRSISPLSTASDFDTAGTAADFSTFNGLNPNGSWTLFVADVVGGGSSSTLNSWDLEITAVPEPTTVTLGIFGSLALIWGLARRCFGKRQTNAELTDPRD